MAKATRKVKAAAATVPVPQTRDQVAEAISRIGILQRARTRIETKMNDEMAALKANYEAEAEPHKREIEALTEGLRIWCEANRAELTKNDRTKTAVFTTGEVRWRVTPPKVVIKGVEAVTDSLKRLGLGRFLRSKEEISKEAILADPDAVRHVAGISIQQTEEFVVEPFETKLEEVA